MAAVNLGPFQTITRVSWAANIKLFAVWGSIQKNNPSLDWNNESITIGSTNFGIAPFDLLNPPLNEPGEGRPFIATPPPILAGSELAIGFTSAMAQAYRCWRYADRKLDVAGIPDGARTNVVILNLTKIKKDFPLLTTLTLSASQAPSSGPSNVFSAAIRTGYLGLVAPAPASVVFGASHSKSFGISGDFAAAITITVANPNISTLT